MTVSHFTEVDLKKRPQISPEIFDLMIEDELNSFQSLVTSTPSLQVFNEIDSQLIELMKIKHPEETLTDDQALSLARKHVGHENFMTYGRWVHYPWINSLVHILPKEEFIQTRTSRNNYKISPQEQEILSTKKVGVIGLSVGQSISLTMAIERVFGEIRIADFDNLELTNLNRIRAGVHQIGLPKVALVAREIAEIDPYLKVSCFWNGINEENIDEFLLANGKLDLVADECDTIHIKFLVRQRCKNLQIPVLMDTSDRGMVDIERFDLEPDRSLFHGLVDHLDTSKIKDLKTNSEKIALTMPLIGLNKASSRIKASMLEIGTSITTWPQLSSDVALGGAISTNIIRRIFLDTFQESGRYYVDTNEIIPDSKLKAPFKPSNAKISELELTNLPNLIGAVSLDKERISISNEDENEILESALLAPSGANCQPWKWLIQENAYYLFLDRHFSASFSDFKDLAGHLTMGCVAENFIITAQNKGYQVKLTSLPHGEDHDLKAVFQLFPNDHISHETEDRNMVDLASYVNTRHTNRNKSARTKLPLSDLEFIQNRASQITGVETTFITTDSEIKEAGELLAMCDQIRLLQPQSHHELFTNEIRRTEAENLKYRDGIDSDLMDISDTDKVGLDLMSDPKVILHLEKWNLGKSLGDMSKELISCSSAVGLISINADSYEDYFKGGRACEKAWITATKLNLAVQPMTVLPYYFNRLREGGEGFTESQKKTLTQMEARFLKLFPSSENRELLFLFRLSEATHPTKHSLRKLKNDLIYKK